MKTNIKILFSALIAVLLITSLSSPVLALPTPTISILEVVQDVSVTISTANFPANREFKVLMAVFGNKGINGIEVEKFDSGTGGSFKKTFAIPAALKGQQSIAIRLEGTTTGYFAYNWFTNTTSAGSVTPPASSESSSTAPNFQVSSVVQGVSVTIKTDNFPENTAYTVLFGAYGTKGIDGAHAGNMLSGTGIFGATITIPPEVASQPKLAIRLENADGSSIAYNWFANDGSFNASNNATHGNNPSGSATTPGAPGSGGTVSGYQGIPTFSIASVVKDQTVTISTNNFPAGKDWKVYMGKYGTYGINGVYITTTSSASGGSFSATYQIPVSLAGLAQIAIRLESTTGKYYAYNWFYNNPVISNGSTPSGGIPGYSGIPTFSISAVIKDASVSIKTNNFPPNIEFKVLMEKFGTCGINGSHVATIQSGSGGTFSATYAIPESLKGQTQIAIRLESTTGFYAYNWFYNTTTP